MSGILCEKVSLDTSSPPLRVRPLQWNKFAPNFTSALKKSFNSFSYSRTSLGDWILRCRKNNHKITLKPYLCLCFYFKNRTAKKKNQIKWAVFLFEKKKIWKLNEVWSIDLKLRDHIIIMRHYWILNRWWSAWRIDCMKISLKYFHFWDEKCSNRCLSDFMD